MLLSAGFLQNLRERVSGVGRRISRRSGRNKKQEQQATEPAERKGYCYQNWVSQTDTEETTIGTTTTRATPLPQQQHRQEQGQAPDNYDNTSGDRRNEPTGATTSTTTAPSSSTDDFHRGDTRDNYRSRRIVTDSRETRERRRRSVMRAVTALGMASSSVPPTARDGAPSGSAGDATPPASSITAGGAEEGSSAEAARPHPPLAQLPPPSEGEAGEQEESRRHPDGSHGSRTYVIPIAFQVNPTTTFVGSATFTPRASSEDSVNPSSTSSTTNTTGHADEEHTSTNSPRSRNPSSPSSQFHIAFTGLVQGSTTEQEFLMRAFQVLFGNSNLSTAGGASQQGQPPASKHARDELEVVVYDGPLQCAVCQDGLGVSGAAAPRLARQMPCGHRFHEECLFPWLELSNTCPTCRYEVMTDNEDYNKGVKRRMAARVKECGLGGMGLCQYCGGDDTGGPVGDGDWVCVEECGCWYHRECAEGWQSSTQDGRCPRHRVGRIAALDSSSSSSALLRNQQGKV